MSSSTKTTIQKAEYYLEYVSIANLFLPLARLLFKTLCPDLVAIRARNPCLRFALVLLG